MATSTLRDELAAWRDRAARLDADLAHATRQCRQLVGEHLAVLGTFRHRHQATEGDLDRCWLCGLDLRHPIHCRGDQEPGEAGRRLLRPPRPQVEG